MKTLYHGNRNKTLEMVQEELFYMESYVLVSGEYISAKNQVDCECLICFHTWRTTPNSLLTGQGCNRCAGRINPSIEELHKEFSSKSFILSYPEGDYTKSTQKLTAICKACGHAWKAVSQSLRKESTHCKLCRKLERKVTPVKTARNLLTTENFQIRMISKGFTLITPYITSTSPIKVQCNTCYRIWDSVPSRLMTNGCAGCSGKIKGSTENTQTKLNKKGVLVKVNGVYKDAFTKLNCICEVCNFRWKAHSHNLINGNRGCPSCAKTGYDPSKPGYLYYLRVSDVIEGIFWKIGITNLGVKQRFPPTDRSKIEVLYCELFEDGVTAQIAERNILNMYKEYRAKGINILRAGNTELFTKDVLQMNHLKWGSEKWR